MNYRMIVKSLGTALLVEAACMAVPLIVSLAFGESLFPFAVPIAAAALLGLAMQAIRPSSQDIYIREGFAIVALCWIAFSLVGALPYVISAAIPDPLDAFFESVSGFTTTGATVVADVEALPRGILFWRSLTKWLGGMGVLVLMLAVLPSVKGSALFILRAEAPGPSPDKFVPKIGKTAKILYLMYVLMTLLQVILLLLGGMPLFDSVVHSLSTAGTGGFSSRNASVGAYGSLYIEIVIAVFMFLFGVNFTLYYMSFKGGLKKALKDEELRFYVLIILASFALISIDTYGRVYHTFWEALRHSSFHVGSVITTTGFSTQDFGGWPVFSQAVILMLMFIGAMAGSTGGGLKCVRALILLKAIKREVKKSIHPKSASVIAINGKRAEESSVYGILVYLAIYLVLVILGILLVSADGKDFLTTSTSVISCINNIGPGLGAAGPAGNYAGFSGLSKMVLSMLMLTGRLEIFPLLMLFTPGFWRRNNI